MDNTDENRAWNLVATRVFGLFEIWLATEVYPNFPIKEGGFNLDTIVLGKHGIMERYVDQKELDGFENLAKAGSFLELLKGFKKYEELVFPFFEKDPLENREEFMKIFRQLWIHEITSFFLGFYVTDQESIDMISDLRGTKSAQHIATSEFLPKLYKQISETLNIDTELLKYALPDEIVSLNLDAGLLTLRQKQYVIESIAGKARLLIGEEAVAYTKEFLKNIKNEIDENISEFKGNPAFKGKVSGKVIIITNENDLVNVSDGDILVSPMTRTSFLPAMQRASAFITDEGGVTCHAAIVARELQKPCIVGTKIATKVLKDGDLVEVDADRGIVKILK